MAHSDARHRDHPTLAQMANLAAIYVVAARLGQLLAIPPGNVTSVWLPSGIMLSAFLLRGPGLWPGVFVGALVGNLWAYLDLSTLDDARRTLSAGVMNGAGDALGLWLGATLLGEWRGLLRTPERVLRFVVLGAALPSAISAGFGVTGLWLFGLLPGAATPYTFLTWLLGDAVGILLITPLSLAWREPWRRPHLGPREGFVLAFCAALTVSGALGLLPGRFSFNLALFALMPVYLWAVFRLNRPLILTAVLVVSATGVLAAVGGAGPFSHDATDHGLLQLQAFMAVLATTTLMFKAVVRQERLLRAQVEELNAELEDRVRERTAALEDELAARARAESATITLERQLQHAQKLESLGVLAGGIAHDYNNMLTAILANAELAAALTPPDSDAHRCMQEVLSVGTRSAAVTQQMLAYSGRGVFQFDRVVLGEHVHRMVPMLGLATRRRVVPSLEVAPDVPPIEADSAQIDQLVMNLVMNAAEALGDSAPADGVSIVVSAREVTSEELARAYSGSDLPSGPYVSLVVQDQGGGMNAKTLDRIFDPFFTTRATGRGLGMAVVLGIVRGHEGAILVDSTVGVGTRFEVLFPPMEG